MAFLWDLSPGDKARVIGFRKGDRAYRQKLLAMGLTPNTEFEVIRKAPLGDPIELKVSHFFLSVRRNEIGMLDIERI